jgi:hypothetical protein
MAVTYQWLGQGDTSGDWMDSNSYYTGSPTSANSGAMVGHIFDGGYKGLSWMLNVFLLPRDFWQKSLSTPYSGQTFPTPATGGNASGQTYPY